MGSKKGRRVRKIDIPTDSGPEFELGDTAADIQWRRDERQENGRRHRNRERRGGNIAVIIQQGAHDQHLLWIL